MVAYEDVHDIKTAGGVDSGVMNGFVEGAVLGGLCGRGIVWKVVL